MSVLLIVAGIGGILLPGSVGSRLLIIGAMILWPRAFRCLVGFFETRFPKLHHQSARQIRRRPDDLETRYPLEK